MIVHFPIAFLILAFVNDLIGLFFGPRSNRFFDRAGFWVLTLALVGLMGAIVTGETAQAFIPRTPVVRSLIKRHELDAFTTAALTATAWIIQAATKFEPGGVAWSVAGTGRGRLTVWSLLPVAGAVIMMIFTAAHGGDLVHRYKV